MLKFENDRKVWVTSDTHYSHTNICRGITNWRLHNGDIPEKQTRPFETLDKMNASIVNNINEVVGQDDVLIHFGDWSFGGFENIELLCNKPPHNNWLIGLINFVKFFQDKNIQKIVEIGSFQGESTSIFALYLPDAKIYAVDPLESGYDMEDIASMQDMSNIQHNFTVRTSKFPNITQIKQKSEEAANSFTDLELDLVYIDGDHRYEAVKRDIMMWKSKIKFNGYISIELFVISLTYKCQIILSNCVTTYLYMLF